MRIDDTRSDRGLCTACDKPLVYTHNRLCAQHVAACLNWLRYQNPNATWRDWVMTLPELVTEPGRCDSCGLPNEYQPGPYRCWQCTQDPYRVRRDEVLR